jgi:ERF superfamily
MHRSSESIAALATALAKAQTKLNNPEKSLTAIIRADRAGAPERSFRYAPLSSGLEIVRKTLGKHEIAVLQTTAIDQTSRSVSLTTMLTHASGEWISSEWPVCPVSDMAAPHRMGAALTYARRYALFTLVGIAGDDDLDAPDLNCQPVANGAPIAGATPRGADAPAPGSAEAVAGLPGRGTGRGNGGAQNRLILTPEASARCRDRLLREIVNLPSSEAAGDWAREVLPLKNTMIARDARLVETAFAFRMSALEKPAGTEPLFPTETASTSPIDEELAADSTLAEARRRSSGSIDKNLLAIPEPRRHRDREHLKLVASKPCLICGRNPAEPHHLRFAQKPALGRKVSDEFAVPLCRLHHRELHRALDETAWWQTARIDPLKIARALWKASRSPKGQGTESSAEARTPAEKPEPGARTPEQLSKPAAPHASHPDSAAGIGK